MKLATGRIIGSPLAKRVRSAIYDEEIGANHGRAPEADVECERRQKKARRGPTDGASEETANLWHDLLYTDARNTVRAQLDPWTLRQLACVNRREKREARRAARLQHLPLGQAYRLPEHVSNSNVFYAWAYYGLTARMGEQIWFYPRSVRMSMACGAVAANRLALYVQIMATAGMRENRRAMDHIRIAAARGCDDILAHLMGARRLAPPYLIALAATSGRTSTVSLMLASMPDAMLTQWQFYDVLRSLDTSRHLSTAAWIALVARVSTPENVSMNTGEVRCLFEFVVRYACVGAFSAMHDIGRPRYYPCVPGVLFATPLERPAVTTTEADAFFSTVARRRCPCSQRLPTSRFNLEYCVPAIVAA